MSDGLRGFGLYVRASAASPDRVVSSLGEATDWILSIEPEVEGATWKT